MDDSHPKMRFSLSPPPPKATYTATSPTTMQTDEATAAVLADEATSDYNQWLHAMKLVARLPGGMPPEFRRKLWLSLADKYMKCKNIDWAKEEEKCFCEKWREDDEELGIQIVKDLHRTGSNLCTGPAGSINQAKLKRILLGYARYNPEVGYCQGFNMLGALILQVMDKEETESMKVMIYLVEGVLPTGYFCGSMGGLQADMGVFRELMQSKLPKLAKHLQKLQGPVENAYEPPLTNVFTMQWFLTMFCTCLPMSCVLRVWDLVLIEGSDVLLRTALVLWGLLEERVLKAKTADDFYCKMGSFSSELLNGHLIDSNGLIEKVVQLGPIPDIQKLRDKHLYNIAPLRHKQGLTFYFDDEEPESDEESRLAVATVWGINWGRRGSQGQSNNNKQTNENKDRIALDISLLKKQYDRLRERQKQAHIILTNACSSASPTSSNANQNVPVNQLLMGRSAIVTNKGRRIGPPSGAIPPARKPSLPAVLQTKPPEKQLRRGETLHWRDTDLSKRRRDSLTWKEIKADRANLLQEGTDGMQTHKLHTRMGKSDSSSYSEESCDDDDDDGGSSTDTSLCDEDDPNSTGDKTLSSSIENSPKRKSKLLRKQKNLPVKLLAISGSRDSSIERRRPKSWAPSSNEIPFTLMTSDSPVHSGDEKSEHLQKLDDFIKEEEDSTTECDRIGYRHVKDLNWSNTKYSPIAGDLATTKLGPLAVQTDILELPVLTSTSQLSPMPDISTYLNNSSISPLPTPKPFFVDSTNSLGSGDGDEAKNFDVNDDGVINEYFERVNSVERPTKLDLYYSLNEEDSIRNAYADDGEPPVNGQREENTQHSDQTDYRECGNEVKESVSNAEYEQENPSNSSNRRMELLMDYSEKSSVAFIAEATNELSTTFKRDNLKDNTVEETEVKNELPERDDNIPGENINDFIETKTLKEEHKASKTEVLQRKHSLQASSRNKRNNPRRLTLTRSTTIEIEERFQALEKHLSTETFSKDKDDKSLIPSTIDLEKRYETIEKQLSLTKSQHQNEIESREEINENICSLSDSNAEKRRNSIPSTRELESRFERQMSNSFAEPNDSNDPGNDGEIEKKKEISKGNIIDTNTEEGKNTIPSSRELESRFERQMSTSVATPKDIINTGKDFEIEKNKEIPKEETIDLNLNSEQTRDSIPSTRELESRFERQMSNKAVTSEDSNDKDNIAREKSQSLEGEDFMEHVPSCGDGNEIRISSTDPANQFEMSEKEMSTNTLKQKNSIDSKGRKENDDSKQQPDESSTAYNIEEDNEANIKQSSEVDETRDVIEKSIMEDICAEKLESVIDKSAELTDSDSNKESFAEKTKDRIPSTANLENRFEALERQMRSKSLTPKNSIDLKNSGKTDEDKEENSKNSPKDESKKDIKKPVKESDTKEESADKEVQKANETLRTPLKKIPSTAELEDRFNQLERKMSVQKCSPAKSKKEPPDGAETPKKVSTTEGDDMKNDQKREVPKGKESIAEATSKKANTENLRKSENTANSPKEHLNEATKSEESNTRTPNKNGGKSKEDTETARKKPPPSTEELEKRFQALEKQLSSANLTTKDEKRTSPQRIDVTSEDKSISKESKTRTDAEISNKVPLSSFEEKCKAINKKLDGKSANSEEKPEHTTRPKVKPGAEKDSQSVQSFHERCRTINQQLNDSNSDERLNNTSTENKKDQKDDDTATSKEYGEPMPTSKRRASEPPSTEDLERRYESLKRRMSTKTITEKQLCKSETVEEALQRIEKDIIEERTESGVEEESTKVNEIVEQPPEDANKKRTQSDAMKETGDIKIKKNSNQNNDTNSNISHNIPIAPPMPKEDIFELIDKSMRNQQRALIDELQHKIKTPQNDENVKPSIINPHRKTPQSRRKAPLADETSETHAEPAFYRSKNYEPWESKTQKMVRRFSDLPSRADLENRLQFLENQLYMKFYKQRCASDSEVASRGQITKRFNDELPSTSTKQQQQSDGELEKRVQALEKQLSENSLKLVEAMRRSEQIQEYENGSPRRLSSETIDATGKELVRYTHFGELEEGEVHKPINISINIKMKLNKNADPNQKRTENFPTAEEMEKRLETLEQQLKNSKARMSIDASKDETKELSQNKEITTEKQEEEKENNIVEKEIKNNSNKEFKEEPKHTSDNIENKGKEIVIDEAPKVSETAVKRDITKEEKTKENQEKAQVINTKEEEKVFDSIENAETILKDVQQSEVALSKSTKTEKIDKENIEECAIEKVTTPTKKDENLKETFSKVAPDNLVINASNIGPVDPNNKTLVLLLDNEPKSVKVRRLTRANTEELEGLFQALEKQISDRNLIKGEDGSLKRADNKKQEINVEKPTEQAKALTNLTKEIEEFTSAEKKENKPKPEPEEEYDWGPNVSKRHLKRKTVYLPSTKELEARFRSLERQIKLLEDVENIDVEQRLNEIERKIKLQYSLSHEKDLSKFLELCEGKGLDETPVEDSSVKEQCTCSKSRQTSPERVEKRSPYTSPSRVKIKTPHTSPTGVQSPRSRQDKRTPPARQPIRDDDIPSTEDLEYRYRSLDLPRSKSKDKLDKQKSALKKQPVHQLEMLLDPSPDDSDIPITGELEHRMRVLEGKRSSPSPPRKSRSRSPTIEEIAQRKLCEDRLPKKPIHNLERLVASPTKREPPTEDELEARFRALEEEQSFDFKTQKNFQEFKEKLKYVVSPSLSFEEFKSSSKSRETSPRRLDSRSHTPSKSVSRDAVDTDSKYQNRQYRSTSPKVIRFRDDEEVRPKSRTTDYGRGNERMVSNAVGVLQIIEENSKMLHRILKTTLTDSNSSIYGTLAATEGLDAMGSRLMRETSPLQRTGTHTGVPLRTNDNINERLSSIKNSIKSIDTLCEEKPYRKEKCQRYIDSLFSDSVHFSLKKNSLEDLSRSVSRSRQEYAPSIRVSDHSKRPSDYYPFGRSMGSAESICSTSPLRAASPLHHRSNRDIHREVSPRRRRGDEDREEYESRVRRDNLLPTNFINYASDLSCSSSSLIKFHKVDSQLDTYKYNDERNRSSSQSPASRSPSRSPYGSREMMMSMHDHNTQNTFTSTIPTTINNNRLDLDRPVSSYRQTSHNLLNYDSLKRSNTPVYNPGKLEIRHTTVTSTFYDRLLTEKQMEKTFPRPSQDRSPLVSPSMASKSYLDIPIASASNSNTKTSNDNSPTTAATTITPTMLGTTTHVLSNISPTNFDIGRNFTNFPTYSSTVTSSSLNPAAGNSLINTHNISTNQTALPSRLSYMVTDAFSTSTHKDLHIRSCDNILMELKSISTTTTAGTGCSPSSLPVATMVTTTQQTSFATTIVTSSNALDSLTATTTINTSYISSFTSPIPNIASNFSISQTSTTNSNINNIAHTNIFTDISNTSLACSTATTSPYATSTTYTPLSIPLTMPLQSSLINATSSLGVYASTLNNNNHTNNATANASYINTGIELPKL